MAKPLQTAKPTVNLATGEKRVSKIRRDPPPVARETVIPDRDESDRRGAAIGIVVFTLALVAVIFALGSWAGWSPSEYTVRLRMH
jgi:hypothetical protein